MGGNQYVLADFGVSEELVEYKEGLKKEGGDTFEVTMHVGGTPLYMSP